jgi:hypothetical protein
MKSPMRLVSAVAILLPIAALAQGGAGAPAARDARKAAEMQKDMEAMQRYGALGPEHARLKSLVGTWDVEATFWMADGEQSGTSKATTEFRSVLADHWLQLDFKGDMMGQPFHGWGFLGYNNSLKKYQSVWFDSWGTGVMSGEGTADKDGKTITLVARDTEVRKNKVIIGKDIWRFESDKKLVYEMWRPSPRGGKLWKAMEIVYTRK